MGHEPTLKSFLVLFFKKERACWLQGSKRFFLKKEAKIFQ